MTAFTTVWGVAAALCVSGRGALLLLIALPLTQLFSTAVHGLWKWWGLPHEKVACTITAVAFGGALWRCLSAVSAENAADLGPVLPLCALFCLCGFSADSAPSVGKLVKNSVALFTVGCVRECLASASVLGISLPFTAVGDVFGRSADGTIGIGGILVAAVVAWVFGLSFPLRPLSSPPRAVWFTALFTAAAGAILSLFPALSVVWRFFAVLTIALVLTAVCSLSLSSWLSVLPAVAVCLVPTLTLSAAVGIGGAVWLFGLALPCLFERLERAPLPRRFSGMPLFLTLAAIIGTVLTAV